MGYLCFISLTAWWFWLLYCLLGSLQWLHLANKCINLAQQGQNMCWHMLGFPHLITHTTCRFFPYIYIRDTICNFVFSAIDAVGVITEQLMLAAIPPFSLLFITGCTARYFSGNKTTNIDIKTAASTDQKQQKWFKRWHYSSARWHSGDVILGNITF